MSEAEANSESLQEHNNHEMDILMVGNRNNADKYNSTEALVKPLESSPLDKVSIVNKFSSTASDWWLWEVLGCLTALVALLAIIITLNAHNNRPLPNWPFSITINSLVSVLATIMKASMMGPVSQGKTLLLGHATEGH